MKLIRLFSLFITLTILCTLSPVSASESSGTYATRGQTAALLIAAADAYNPNVSRAVILKGYADGSIREDQPVTRAEAFVMVSRAFGALPAPNAHNTRTFLPKETFSDVPNWARSEIENLTSAGILAGTGNGKLSPDRYVTCEQLQLIIRRIWALYGSNLKDDFYESVNKDTLANMEILPGNPQGGNFLNIDAENNKRVSDIIQDIVDTPQSEGSREKKISNLYRSVVEALSRDETDLSPIQKYLDALDNAQNVDDLLTLRRTIYEETGRPLLFTFTMAIDDKNSSEYIMTFTGMSYSMSKELYAADSGKQKDAYLNYLTGLYELSGMDSASAQAWAEMYYSMEKTIAAASLSTADLADIDMTYHLYTISQLDEIFPHFHLIENARQDGFATDASILVRDKGLMQAYAKLCTPEHLTELKALMKMNIMSGFAATLSNQVSKLSEQFQRDFMGVEGSKTKEETASMMTQNLLSDYIGQLYVEKYFSAEAKEDVEDMVRSFIEIYKSRIQNLDWMSDDTKQMALKKLDTLNVKIGYPDEWNDFADGLEIKSPEEGGTYFSNMCDYWKKSRLENVALQGKTVDRSVWQLTVYTVNAYYDPQLNEIVFPAGILQAPFYDIAASREENLGGIGTVIAHEITHSFDNNGSKYDEKGNAANWWADEDLAEFQKRCDKVVAFYDGWEAAPGIRINGDLTLGENIADLGGMSCALEAAKSLPNPDYRKLFENNARCWATTASRDYLVYASQVDMHSPTNLRCNRIYVNFEEFYQAYGIGPGDGMYVAPQDRISVW